MLYSFFACNYHTTNKVQDNWAIIGFNNNIGFNRLRGKSLIDTYRANRIGTVWNYDNFYGLFEDLKVIYE